MRAGAIAGRYRDGRHFKLALSLALLSVLLVFAWQSATVRVNYQGNWTGLFRIGSDIKMPDSLAEGAFRNAHPIGYDGQYYRVLAHDPLLRKGWASFMDDPLLRARRILVPALAWVLVLGQPALIDGAYVFVILAWIFIGTYWLTRIILIQGRHPAWGLSFLCVPAVLIAVDSMTVDVAIAALAAGFAWHLMTGRLSVLWLILATAGLVRETGLLLVAACVLASLYQKDWRKAAVWATALFPVLLWYAYLHGALAPTSGVTSRQIPKWVMPNLELGIVVRMLNPLSYAKFSPGLRLAARVLDELALASMIGVAVLAVIRLRNTRPMQEKIALLLYVLLMLALTARGFWTSAYGFGRPFVPLFVLLLAGNDWKSALVFASLVDLRILAEYYSQAMGVLNWLLGR